MIATEGKTIVVVGATGRQGGQVVRHLVRDGWLVRAMTRKPESKKSPGAQGPGRGSGQIHFPFLHRSIRSNSHTL